MKWKAPLAALAFAAATTALMAQDATQTTTTTKTTTVTGSVVQYQPGQTIVVRSSDGKTVTYSLGPSVQVPAGVQVGKTVTLSTEPASSGSGNAVVTRVETTSVDASGQTTTTSERTEQSAAGTTKTTTTTYGTVTAYEPKSSITIEGPNHETVTYMLDTSSELPSDIAIGKVVTIDTRSVPGSKSPVVRRVIYKKVETKVEPQ
jgi:hypothetical protein